MVNPFVREDFGTFLKTINRYKHTENASFIKMKSAGFVSNK